MLAGYLNSQFSLLQNLDFVIRILVSCACGFALGIERSRRFKEAGVRTHMIVSKYGFADLLSVTKQHFNGTRGADPARLAAQVVSGVSFLGAGMIFKNGGSVTGLTTAAGIWATAGIGLAIGSGMYVVGILVTIAISLIQMLMHIVTVGADSYRCSNIDILVADKTDFQSKFNELMKRYNANVIEFRITKEGEGYRYNATVKSKVAINADELNAILTENEEIKEISILNV